MKILHGTTLQYTTYPTLHYRWKVLFLFSFWSRWKVWRSWGKWNSGLAEIMAELAGSWNGISLLNKTRFYSKNSIFEKKILTNKILPILLVFMSVFILFVWCDLFWKVESGPGDRVYVTFAVNEVNKRQRWYHWWNSYVKI